MISREKYEACLTAHAEAIREIREAANEVHNNVAQKYGGTLPYVHHLDMVVDEMRRYGHQVVTSADDVLPLLFGGYFHDSIEDARLSYNDVKRTAQRWMSDEQALMAAEIVYALTNDKGRTRAERAGEHYYEGIRTTPYAPFAKLCDRLANVTHSVISGDALNDRMKKVYGEEMPHFVKSITAESDDPRLLLPPEAVDVLLGYLK